MKDEGVYDAFPEAAARIIDECPAVSAYAVADKKLGWMLVEDHHHRMFAVGVPAISRLVAISEDHAALKKIDRPAPA